MPGSPQAAWSKRSSGCGPSLATVTSALAVRRALASAAARLGVIDEYRPWVYPVLVGGGIPFYPQSERRVDLELLESRPFGSQTVYTATAWRASGRPTRQH